MARPVTIQRPGWPGTRLAYDGFSWTTLFWGPLPALFRGDGVGFLIGLGVGIASLLAWTAFLGWIPWIIWAAVYNRNHLDRLAAQGWIPVTWALAVPALAPLYPVAAPHLSAPPGWYSDPLDPSRRRWWDGSAWGEPVI